MPGAHRLDELTELAAMCCAGRLAEAELALHDWCRSTAAPDAARALLAALLLRRGADADAQALLDRWTAANVAADPDLARLLLARLLLAGDDVVADRVAVALHDRHGHDPTIAAWLRVVAEQCRGWTRTSDSAVHRLVADLQGRLDLIPSLVAAQRIEPRPAEIDLLRRAIGRVAVTAVDESDLLTICTAMAQLALLAFDADDVRRWAHRGLKIDPYNASLALALAEVRDDPAVGPAAADVLRRVASAHPDYPDVRARLIRREQADGRVDAARLRLAQWLEQDPANPMALDLVRELAA